MSLVAKKEPFPLTRFPSGGIRELLYLSLPITIVVLASCLMGLFEKIMLARHSMEAMQGALNATYLCRLFQLPFISLVMMLQVFVGYFCGSCKLHRIGNCTWQMIWFSLFSMVITLPLSEIIVPLFFKKTLIEQTGTAYFHIQACANFLFPLGAAFSSFYFGIGKTRLVVFTTITSYTLNFLLDVILIFGVEGFVPPLGIKGASIATVVCQTVFSLILMLNFLSKANRKNYRTDLWKLNPSLLWSVLQVGIPRALGRTFVLIIWMLTAHIMTAKGEHHLMVLSIGGTLILFLSSLGEGINRAMVTIASNMMGSQDYSKIWALFRSGLVFTLGIFALLSIPLVVFPKHTLALFFFQPPTPELETYLVNTLFWVWFFILMYGITQLFLSLIAASKDTVFYMTMVLFVWATSYFPAYIAINVWDLPPDKFWFVMFFENAFIASVYYLRTRKELWKNQEKSVFTNAGSH